MFLTLALMGLNNNAYAANPEMQAVERRVGSLEWRVAQLEEMHEPDAEEIEEITEEAEEIAEDIAECGEPCSDLAERLDTVEADAKKLQKRVTELERVNRAQDSRIGDLDDAREDDEFTFISLSVGVANHNTFRVSPPDEIIVGMPWRQHGIGLTAEVCGEYLLGSRVAMCGYVSPQRYGYNGNLLTAGGKAYFLATPSAAFGASLGYTGEWLDVYGKSELFGASTGGSGLAHLRVSPGLLGNDVFATDLHFYGGVSFRENRVLGGAEYSELTTDVGVSLSFRVATEGKRY